MAGTAALTDRSAVLAAMREYDEIGRDAFLDRHHFGRAKWWYAVHDGKQYDSKAIVGVAIGIQTGTPLMSNDFGGGEGSVVRRLNALGFKVLRTELTDELVKLPEEVEDTYPEGLRIPVLVNRAERSTTARLACISIYGTSCAVCGMSFEKIYGMEFQGLIHVHHLTPLGGRTEMSEVNPREDLRPVCPNCHAAIHFGSRTRTLDELRAAMAAAHHELSRARDVGAVDEG